MARNLETRGRLFESFGKHLLTARVNRGLSQRDLADRCGLTQSYLSLLERGARTPTLVQLGRLAEVLYVPLQWFISGKARPGEDWRDLAIELYNLGIVDLLVAGAVVPGAFRPVEQVVAVALSGDQVEPRVVEAVPAILAWNDWNVRLLHGYARAYDRRVSHRAAWLADVAQTIHTQHGFPGGCVNPRKLSALWRYTKRPAEPDSLGYPSDEASLPPVSRRWNITYAADLETFRRRAEHLHELRTSKIRSLMPKRER
jgi:transcriptional regulator with XRE-family HTH domain